MIDLQQLRQLVAVEEAGTLSEAAERLHMSQPALSRSMQRLEAELGLKLFEHRKNRLVFRELGLRAAEGARQLLRDAERFTEDLRDYALRLSIVRIGATAPAPLWRLSTVIHERFPDVILTEEQQDAEALIAGLREGRFRLVLTHAPVEEPGVLCRKYLEERLQLELPPDHALASRSVMEEGDLNGLTVLSFRHIGVWRKRLAGISGLHLIEQTELDVLEDLAFSSGLPLLTSSLGFSRSASVRGHVTLPIVGDAAVLPFYLCGREQDRELYNQLC